MEVGGFIKSMESLIDKQSRFLCAAEGLSIQPSSTFTRGSRPSRSFGVDVMDY